MAIGYLCLVLHAHLPFVRHPEHDDFLEEDWLYEAITETYIPLLEVFDGLERDGVDWRLTMSVTPTLAAMLDDPLLQSRYVRHINKLIRLSEKELDRTSRQPELYSVARMYHKRFTHALEVFSEQYDCNLLNGFRRFFKTGNLELITCAATHGFLPLLATGPVDEERAIAAQVEIGCQEFARHFGKRPAGIWLPECGYAPGVDAHLRNSGIDYFFTDTHGVIHAEPRPRFGVYAPIISTGTGVAALGRDAESSKQVWSGEEGYPGDWRYREYYRDVGHDLDYDYIRPFLHDTGIRTNLGIKYFRITGRTDHKDVYDPQAALEIAARHAGNFMFNREKQAEWLIDNMNGRPPLIVAPYDAELFGHWWFEGPDWLNHLLRRIQSDQDNIKTITIPEYLQREPNNQECSPAFSSWGHKGYCEVWLESSNDWIYRHLHNAATRMSNLARRFPDARSVKARALNQAARELLLAQSSDWAFIMKTGTMVEYALARTKSHVINFDRLYRQISSDDIDEGWLQEIEQKDNLFPELDYAVYA